MLECLGSVFKSSSGLCRPGEAAMMAQVIGVGPHMGGVPGPHLLPPATAVMCRVDHQMGMCSLFLSLSAFLSLCLYVCVCLINRFQRHFCISYGSVSISDWVVYHYFLLSYVRSLYILNIKLLSDIDFANIFFIS